MGVVPEENTKRNEDLYKDYRRYLNKEVYMVDLVNKYKVSSTRIIQIGKKYLSREIKRKGNFN